MLMLRTKKQDDGSSITLSLFVFYHTLETKLAAQNESEFMKARRRLDETQEEKKEEKRKSEEKREREKKNSDDFFFLSRLLLSLFSTKKNFFIFFLAPRLVRHVSLPSATAEEPCNEQQQQQRQVQNLRAGPRGAARGPRVRRRRGRGVWRTTTRRRSPFVFFLLFVFVVGGARSNVFVYFLGTTIAVRGAAGRGASD